MQNRPLMSVVTKFGFDTAENGPSKVWAISNQHQFPPWGQINIYVHCQDPHPDCNVGLPAILPAHRELHVGNALKDLS